MGPFPPIPFRVVVMASSSRDGNNHNNNKKQAPQYPITFPKINEPISTIDARIGRIQPSTMVCFHFPCSSPTLGGKDIFFTKHLINTK